MNQSWSFTNLWNESIIREQRELKPRDYAWASEIGQPLVNRWLKMRGVKPTNPPNMRSLRKFEAGNLVEWVCRFVLSRVGIIHETQEEVWTNYDGLLPVKGKLDFKAGGVIDVERAAADISALHLPQSITDSSLYMATKLVEKYGDRPLKDIILEIKSCSTFVMDAMEKSEQPITHHRYQCFHYLKGLEMHEGHLVYICKDDLRMSEFTILNPSHVEDEYVADLKAMTYYHENNEQPPLEPLIKWVPEEGKFKKNLGVEYSDYLTMLYSYQSPREYSDHISGGVARWNRVLKRYASGAKITAKNEEVKSEIIKAGYHFDEIIYTVQRLGVQDEEENED